jgi:rhodanese-related sulfurtransferase
MFPHVRWLLPALVIGLLASATAPAGAQDPASLRPAVAARYPDVRWVGTAELARWIAAERGPRVVLLDARAAAEHRVSHLRGAVRVELDGFDAASVRLPRDARIVVYCSVGWRSAAVAESLRRAGFTHVHNLEGGIFAWANEGRPVYRGGSRVRDVHPFDRVWGRFLRQNPTGSEPGSGR